MPLEMGSTKSRSACSDMVRAARAVGVVTAAVLRISRPMSRHEFRDTMSRNHCGNGRNGSRFSGMKWLVEMVRTRRFSASVMAASPIM